MTADTTDQPISYAMPRRSVLRRVAIVASLLLVLAAVAASLFIVRSIDTQAADMATNYEVRRQARELLIALVDAETSQRGYLISRDAGFLEPYNAAVQRLNETYDALVAMIGDDPELSAQLASIVPDLDTKRGVMAATIELLSEGRVSDAYALVRTDTGLELMNRIRQAMRAFIDREDARLEARNAELTVQRQLLFVAILLALGGAAILALGLLTRSQRRVTALFEQQSHLKSQNEELEAHVAARTREAEEARAHAERERARLETLLQDTNHRIGNSLATVSSLLGLQLTRTTSEEVRHALEAAQTRVQTIASAHRRLRLGDDLETTNAADFLGDVINDLARTLPSDRHVTIEKQIEPMVIPARDATTIGIVVSELVTNAVKHAFPDGNGTIWVRLQLVEGVPDLTVEDDGTGMAGGEGQSGLGALIIKQLARQFGGDEPIYGPRAGGGTSVSVKLPRLVVPGR